jgi:hypothetical protein
LIRFVGSEPQPPSRGLEAAAADGLSCYALVQFDAAGLEPPEEGTAAALLDSLPESTLPFTPALLGPGDAPDLAALVADAWGKGALVCLFSAQAKPELLSHLRASAQRSAEAADSSEGVGAALGWPRAASGLLQNGDPQAVAALLEGIDAVLIEAEDGEGFELFGSEALEDGLRRAGFVRDEGRGPEDGSGEAT